MNSGAGIATADSRDTSKNRYFANDAQGQSITVVQGQYDGQSGRWSATQAFQYRASEREGWTVRSRAHVVGAIQAALGLSLYLFLSFPVGEAYYEGTVTGVALGAMAVVSLYQLIAGMRYLNRRWRTRDDVVRMLQRLDPKAGAAMARPYDWAFYGAVVIASRLLRLEFGDGTVLIIVGFLVALTAPFLIGLGTAKLVRVRALVPEDAPLDA